MHSFTKYLLSMYYVTNLVLGTRDKTMKNVGKALERLCSSRGLGDNTQVNKCKLIQIVKKVWKKIKQRDPNREL